MAIGQLHHIARQLFKALPSLLLEARVKVVRFEVATQLAQKLHIYYNTLIKLLDRSYHKTSSRRCIVCNIAKIIIVRG